MEQINVFTAAGEPYLRYLSPLNVLARLWKRRQLIRDFTRRELQGKYHGTYLGMLWTIITPLFLLLVYSFAFSVILNSGWPSDKVQGLQHLAEDKGMSFATFSVILFAGLVAYNFVAETLGASAGVLVNNPQYVAKMVFPLEVLPVALLLAGVINNLASLLVLLLGIFLISGGLPATFPLILLVLLPLWILMLGICYLTASLGVFIRDMSNFINTAIVVLFFASPVFYPMDFLMEKLPEDLAPWVRLNPLATIIYNCRRVAVYGEMPEWIWLAVLYAVSLVVLSLGFTFFQKSRKAFSDVL